MSEDQLRDDYTLRAKLPDIILARNRGTQMHDLVFLLRRHHKDVWDEFDRDRATYLVDQDESRSMDGGSAAIGIAPNVSDDDIEEFERATIKKVDSKWVAKLRRCSTGQTLKTLTAVQIGTAGKYITIHDAGGSLDDNQRQIAGKIMRDGGL